MPPKYAYLYRCVEMMCLFKFIIGYVNDQSVEGFNKLEMRRQKRTAMIDEITMINIFNGDRNLNSVFVCDY